MHSRCLDFFLLSFELGGGFFFHYSFVPNMLPLCYFQVPNGLPLCYFQVPNMFPKFPMCSPRVIPIAPHFNPICFAQSPPLLTFIAGPKGEALQLSIESCILGEPSEFQLFFFFFCNGPIKITHCKKKKLDL